jgi:hypothetical protein
MVVTRGLVVGKMPPASSLAPDTPAASPAGLGLRVLPAPASPPSSATASATASSATSVAAAVVRMSWAPGRLRPRSPCRRGQIFVDAGAVV